MASIFRIKLCAGFDQQLVGPKGQGYRWHSHGADAYVLRFSIAPPPPLGPDESSDEESQAATNDEAPDVQPMDPDVGFPCMPLPCKP